MLLSLAMPARAEDDAAAQALFEAGRKLMAAKHYADACQKFEASERMSPALGTLLNLADCLEKNGQLASAWMRFKQAQAEAAKQHRADREATARNRAATLEPRLPTLQLRVPHAAPGERVVRDSVLVDPGAYGLAVPVDPGRHHIEATAPGKVAWSRDVEVDDGTAVDVPSLPDERRPDVPGRGVPAAQARRGGAQRIAGLTVAGIGIAGLAVGGVFGSLAISDWQSANCTNGRCSDRSAAQRAAEAGTFADVATAAFVGGAILATAGVAVFFAAPREKTATALALHVTPWVSAECAGAAVSGRF